jgi:uncharacterized protein YukE
MRPTPILTLLCYAFAAVAIAQQPGPPGEPAPPPVVTETPPPAHVETEAGHESPPAKEPLQARVRRLLDDFDQRHQQRMLEMSAYDNVGNAEPGVKQFADPRKVEVELKDEQDREQTSTALAKEYAEESRQVQTQEQALQAFIAKRQKTVDGLTKRASTVNQQDLELAAANLARQPGTEAQVSEIRHRLSEAERNAQELSSQQAQSQRRGRAEEARCARAVARKRVQSLHGRRCLGPSEPVASGRSARVLRRQRAGGRRARPGH